MRLKWKKEIDTHNRVGARLRELRQGYGLTQAYVASVIGCSPAAVGHIESGHAGSMELLESVLWAYGLDLGDLKLDRGALVSLQRARRIREAAAAKKKRRARIEAPRRRATA